MLLQIFGMADLTLRSLLRKTYFRFRQPVFIKPLTGMQTLAMTKLTDNTSADHMLHGQLDSHMAFGPNKKCP